MLQILPRCTTYNENVKKARRLIKFKSVIALFPAILLIAIGIVLAIVLKQPYLLILSVVGVAYYFIIRAILSQIFKRHTAEILTKFNDHYHPTQPIISTTLIDDNQNLALFIKQGNPLQCWSEQEQLKFITSKINHIRNLKLMKTSIVKFNELINSDFGELNVPHSDIDHYRESTLVCKYGADICRLKFADEKAFEKFIATKEYYYASHKKEWI